MRLIKIFGLAIVSALTAMALIGTGSASATVLCKALPNSEGECPSGETVSSATITGKSGEGVLKTSLGNISCSTNAFEANLTSSGGTVEGTAEVLTFGEEEGAKGCTSSVLFCGKVLKIKQLNNPQVLIIYESPNTLFEALGILHKPRVLVQLDCGIFGKPTCEYGFNANEQVQFEVDNSAQFIAVLNAPVFRSAGGALCPEEGKLSVTHTITSPLIHIADN